MIIRILKFTTMLILALGIAHLTAGEIIDKKIRKSDLVFLTQKPEYKILDKLPRKTKSIDFNDHTLYVYENTYFVLSNSKYCEVLPPYGLEVKELPAISERIIRNGQVIYYANGVYYSIKENDKGFVVIPGPSGVQISKLPKNCIRAKLNDLDCYVYFDSVYKKASSRTGNIYALIGYIDE